MIISSIIFVIIVTAVLFLLNKSNKFLNSDKRSKVDVVCDENMANSFDSEMIKSQPNFDIIIAEIQSRKNYEKDPTCQAIMFLYGLHIKNKDVAQKSMQKIETLGDDNKNAANYLKSFDENNMESIFNLTFNVGVESSGG